MRIAVLSDIHGLVVALDAVLADAEDHGVDALVALGDVVNGGPDSDLALARLRDHGVPWVRGNHERYVVSVIDDEPAFRGANWDPARAAAAQLSEEDVADLRHRPTSATLVDLLGEAARDLPPLTVCHASPRDDATNAGPDTPEADVGRDFGVSGAPTVVRGHNHQPFERRVRAPDGARLHVIGVGSVGISLDGTRRAQYAWLEPDSAGGWRATPRWVPYDVDAAAAAFHARDHLEHAGPLAEIVLREVRTGRRQMVPFMRFVAGRGPRPTSREGWRTAVDAFMARPQS